MKCIMPQPLTAQAFTPYGDVIEASGTAQHFAINHGHTMRYNDLAHIEIGEPQGRSQISLFRTKPLKRPLIVRLMERHPLSSQAFYPLSPRPYLVVVAAKAPFPSDIKIFVAGPDQGVNYRPGVWHHFSLALGGDSDFLVIDRKGPGDNLEEVKLTPDQCIEIDESGLPPERQKA